jgi:hypothetical protein
MRGLVAVAVVVSSRHEHGEVVMRQFAIMLDGIRASRGSSWPISRESDSLDDLRGVTQLSTPPSGVSTALYRYVEVAETRRTYVLVYESGQEEPGAIWELVR